MIFRGKTVSPFDRPQTAVQFPQLKHRPSVRPPNAASSAPSAGIHSVVLHDQPPSRRVEQVVAVLLGPSSTWP